MEFKKLNPTDDVELGIYDKAMEFVFSDDDIQNIAISGAYGAGKSSILKSYKRKLEQAGKKTKFLHISLAHFENTEGENTGYEKLEGKILNQLLHQIKAESIPLTKFKIKRAVDTPGINRMTTCVVGLFAIILYFIFYKQWSELVVEFRDISLQFTLAPWFKVMLIAAALGIMAYLVNYIIKIQTEKNVFKKFSFQGTEIELFQEENASYFDKYLNEVIYLFDCSGADVIVFEDMDRFNDVRIFERLREINQLINTGRKEAEKEPLRFFYLLRDDIFSTKDRTKFFDYIIPVVPVVDGSNSYSELKNTLQEEIEQGRIDAKFLQGIALFIDDMRALKNICNEFFVYNERINEINLDRNNLLAMITYKNLFPKDFSDLQLGKGYIYTVLSNKKDIIEDQLTSIEDKMKDIDCDLQKIDREILTDRQEVGAALAVKYYSGYSWASSADVVQWIQNRRDQKVIDELEERIRIVELKHDDRKEELLKEKKKLTEQKQRISEKPLHQLITKENEKKVFGVTRVDFNGKEYPYEYIKGNDYFPLLKYLVWNGYLDESYQDYMTYFYEGKMKKGDKVFLRAVAGHETQRYDYAIQDPEVVISGLRNCDFEQEETLNYDLFAYLLQDPKHKLETQRTRFIQQIKEGQRYDFLSGFLETKKNMDEPAVKYLCTIWPENFKELLHAVDVSADFIWRWATDLVCYVSENILEQVNEKKVLSAYISKERKALNMEENCRTTFAKNAKVLEILVEDLQVYDKDDPVYHLLVENSLYEISMPNIKFILKTIYGETDETELDTLNYTVLRRHEESNLYQYLTENMEDYASCFVESAAKIQDDRDTVLTFLNDEALSDNTKRKYIAKLETQIETLADIHCETVWDGMMSKGILRYSGENLLYYYENKGLTEELVAYINALKTPINFLGEYKDKEDTKKKLFGEIVKNDTLELDKYQQLVATLGYHYPEFGIKDIDQDRMEILIKNKIVLMNAKTLSFMRENYEQNMVAYLAAGFDEYLLIVEEADVTDKEISLVLDDLLLSKRISEKQALSFLQKLSAEISLNRTIYPVRVMAELLKNHLSEDDLEFLFEQYHTFAATIQEIVIGIALDKVTTIVKGKSSVSKYLIMELMKQSGLSQSDRKELLAVVISLCDREEIKKCLNECGKGALCKIFDPQARPRYEITAENEKLLQAFKERGYISEYPEDKEQNYYRIRRAH